MERVASILERERELLESLLFKLVETRLILQANELRFLGRATGEVDLARTRCREIDLVRAATVDAHTPGASLRELASGAQEPWPGILRDHHDTLASVVAEIELTAHQNAELARLGLDAMKLTPVPAGAVAPSDDRTELNRLARGAALTSVLGTAARLRMPDLLLFLR
ncbi:MAG: hypothetical protein KDB02_08685 [Acidimicrobiales bacterium]|nr:hypothetical protein [Acidimicrobiales bacterium]